MRFGFANRRAAASHAEVDRDVRPASPRHRRWTSRQVHQVGLITSHAWAGWLVLAAALMWVGWGGVVGFPSYWAVALESTTSIVTIVMLFAFQHLQERNQTVIHRKLDEILRSNPDANNQMISLEHASDEHLDLLTERNRSERLS